MKKRALTLLLALAMCMSLCIPAIAMSSEVSQAEKIDRLVRCGIPQSAIAEMDETIIDPLYETSLTNDIKLAGINKVVGTLEPNESGIMPTLVTDGDFSLTTFTFEVVESDRKTFRYFAVYTKYEWTKAPLNHRKDGLVVNWDSNLLTCNATSIYQVHSFKGATGTKWSEGTKINAYDTKNSGGIGITFNLKNNPNYLHRGTLYFELEKQGSHVSGRYTSIDANYAHTVTSVAADSITIGTEDASATIVCTTTYQNQAASTNVTIP